LRRAVVTGIIASGRSTPACGTNLWRLDRLC